MIRFAICANTIQSRSLHNIRNKFCTHLVTALYKNSTKLLRTKNLQKFDGTRQRPLGQYSCIPHAAWQTTRFHVCSCGCDYKKWQGQHLMLRTGDAHRIDNTNNSNASNRSRSGADTVQFTDFRISIICFSFVIRFCI